MSSGKKVLDLPGFYFDKDKNRYFRLIPGQEHVNPLTGESLQIAKSSKCNTTEKRYHSSIKDHFGSCGRKRPKNVCSLVSIEQVSLEKFKSSILSSLFLQSLNKESLSNASEIFEYFNDIIVILPSENRDKLLFQSKDSKILLVDNKMNDGGYTQYDFSLESCSSLTDFSFATTQSAFDAVLVASEMSRGGSTIFWGPDSRYPYTYRKYSKKHIGACKWHKECLVYGLDSNFMWVNNCSRHFTDGSFSAGGYFVKTKTVKSNYLTKLNFSCNGSLAYAGHRNGQIFVYDNRNLPNAVNSFGADSDTKNVCDIHILPNECHVISKYGSSFDCTCLWDVRFAKKPILLYGKFANSKNLGFRGMLKHCFLDLSSDVMSCYHVDGKLRFWDIQTGENVAETSKLEGGIFSQNWMVDYKKTTGIVGLKHGKVVWLPLRNTMG